MEPLKSSFRPVHWKKKERPIGAAIKNWSPQLFACCMGTGALALNLNQLPYQFNGLRTIAVVGFIIDLGLWLSIASGFLLRVAIYPRSTWKLFNEDMEATTYLSCVSIASSTLIDLAFVIPGSNWDNWRVACAVLWWIDVGMALIAGLLPYWVAINHERLDLKRMMPSLVYPALAMTSTAAAGAVVCQNDKLSENLAIPIVVTSYVLAGLGFFLAILVQSVLMTRLIEYNAPEAKKSPTLFVCLGPINTTAYSIELLGRVAGPSQHIFENAAGGQARYAGDVAFGFGLLFGLMLVGFATFWLLIASMEIITNFQKSSFTLNTWSAIYPIGTYALALNQLSKDFDSPAFKVLTTIFTVICLLQWLYAVVRTLPMIITGSLFLEGVPDGEDTSPQRRRKSKRDVEGKDDAEAQGEKRNGRANGDHQVENGHSS